MISRTLKFNSKYLVSLKPASSRGDWWIFQGTGGGVKNQSSSQGYNNLRTDISINIWIVTPKFAGVWKKILKWNKAEE